jgi:hypothetical protein
MKIDFKVQENVNGIKYKLEVYSSDGQNFRVAENDSRYHEYSTRVEFASHFPEAAKWIFGDV